MGASLERIIRPVIPPDVRPTPAPVIPADDADRSVATIAGGGGQVINLGHSFSHSFSRSKRDVQFRIFHRIRVYANKTDEDGNNLEPRQTDFEKYIDIEWNLVIRMKNEVGVIIEERYFEPQDSNFVDAQGDQRTWEIADAYVREVIPESRLPPSD